MQTQWWGIIPFVVMLGCIAVAPLVEAVSGLWERQRVQLLVSLVLGVPVAVWFLAAGEGMAVAHSMVEYAQFIILLLALFVVSGGIYLTGDLRASPRTNTTFLGVGAVLASIIGTTGAAMLLIRPLLNTNAQRRWRVHTVVFCIFVVANCGGLLTPLGDPPLFLGMLRGVPFLWTLRLVPEWLFVNGLLLVTYWALDHKLYAQESPKARAWDRSAVAPLGVEGRIHLLYLVVVVAAVALAPSIDLHAIEEGHAGVAAWVPWRELVLLGVAALSIYTGDKRARWVHNTFRWGPILEVAALFVGIFLTMIPALRYLAQVAPSLPLNELTFFFFTGGLSSVLDNAPTYLTFFEMAQQLGGEPAVAGVYEPYLVAISTGAVFCGAVTYIGNGPNFMVKAVADSAGVLMPSFGGYIVAAFTYLVPTLVAMALVFVATTTVAHLVGIALAALLLVRAVWVASRHRNSGGPRPADPRRE
ncbi:sodium:proton antiporter [Intrasporangium sp.]|uniref:sodium:proton antiporter n=1 Tax=Intrasporangium sp. TaxID=1925024 RepID=UPI003221D1F5